MYIHVVHISFLTAVTVANLALESFPIVTFLSPVVRILHCSSYNYLVVMYTGITVRNVLWNPGFPGIFAVCLSSGSVVVMELTEMEIKTLATLPGSVKANASR